MRVVDAKWIDDLAGVFTDPIIVYPGGWEDTIPQKLREAVTIERLIGNMKHAKGEPITATDAECCIYIYTVCMCQPLSHEWAQIYFYLSTKFVEKDGRTMPDDMRLDKLTDYEHQLLGDLRGWIYRRRLAAREDRCRRERAQAREGGEGGTPAPRRPRMEAAEPSPQLQLF